MRKIKSSNLLKNTLVVMPLIIIGIYYCFFSSAISTVPQEEMPKYANFSNYKKKPKSEKAPKETMSAAEKAINENKLKRYLAKQRVTLRNPSSTSRRNFGKSYYADGKISGVWKQQEFVSKSGKNKGFRTTNSAYDKAKDKLYVVSNSGHLWQVNKNETDNTKTSWNIINNKGGFSKKSLHVLNLPNGDSRMVRSNGTKMQFSQDDGRNWSDAKGVAFQTTWDNSGVQAYGTGQRVLALVKADDEIQAVTSTDGINYDAIGTFSNASRVLELPNSDNLYILSFENNGIKTYKLSSSSNSLVLMHNVSMNVNTRNKFRVFGTYTNGAFHFYYATIDHIYYSDNEGASWTLTRSAPYSSTGDKIPRTVDFNNPNTIFRGYLDYYISTNRGKDFEGTKNTLGWDMHHMKNYRKRDGSIFHLVGGDFGLFMSYTPENVDTYINLNNGASHAMAYDADASQYSYSNAALQDRGSIEFEQTEKTGIANIRSTDGLRVTYANNGKSSWTWIYFGSMYHKSNKGYQTGALSSRQFTGKWWASVLVESPNPNEDAVYIGGYNSLKKFSFINNEIVEEDHPYDFGERITGFGYSSVDRNRWYVSTKKGDFYYSKDGGVSFTKSIIPFKIPIGDDQGYNYHRNQHTIKTSATNPDRVYYVGVGNNAMLISNDGGKTFTEHAEGLSIYRFRDIAVTEDDAYVFAACGGGGMWVFSTADNKWYEMFDTPIPNVNVTSVEYLAATKLVQFSTYGYGIMQFWMDGLAPDQQAMVNMFNNPNKNLQIINGTRTIKSGTTNQNVLPPALGSTKVRMYNASIVSDEHIWQFQHIGNKMHTILNLRTGKYLNVANFKCEDRASVVTSSAATDDSSRWYIDFDNGNYYLLPVYCTNQALSKQNTAAEVVTWKHNKTYANQKFKILPVEQNLQIIDGLHTIKSQTANKNVISPSWDGNNVRMYDASTIYDGHKWQFKHLGDNIHTIQNVRTGRYLNVGQAKCSNEANILTWTDVKSDNSKWYIDLFNGNYYLLPVHCPTQVLSVKGSDFNVVTWQYNPTYDNQKFDIVPYVPQNFQTIDGLHTIKSQTTNQNVISPSWDDNNVRMYNASTIYDGHKWQFKHLGDNIHTIQNIRTGHYLNVDQAKCNNEANVLTWTDATSDHSKWYIDLVDGNYYLLPVHCPTQALSKLDSEQNVVTWQYNPTYANQKFDIVPYMPQSMACDYQLLSGKALDIGSGGGETYVVGMNGQVFRWQNERWVGLTNAFKGKRIDVTGAGIPWVVAEDNKIYYYDNNSWKNVNGRALDIGCNKSYLYVIGENRKIYKRKGNRWVVIPDAAANRIDVDSNGNPWVINNNGTVFQYKDNKWIQRGLLNAKDISVAEGSTEIWGISKLNEAVFEYKDGIWNERTGNAQAISIGQDKTVWIVNTNNQILRNDCHQTGAGSRTQDRISDLRASTTLAQKTNLEWVYYLPQEINKVASYTFQFFDKQQNTFVDIQRIATKDIESPNKIQTTFKHKNPQVGANYYRVAIEFINGIYAYSEEATVTFDAVLSSLVLSPNPAKEVLYISLADYQQVSIKYTILNIRGEMIARGRFDKEHSDLETIDLNTYQNGNYLIYLQPENHRGITKKFIVMNDY